MPPAALPIIQSIPHGGMDAPELLRDLLALDETAIYNECDLWVEQLYDFAPSTENPDAPGSLAVVTTLIARAIVDVNRPPADLQDPDGPIKAQTSYGTATWRRPLALDEKRLLLEQHHAPWHQALAAALTSHQGSVRLLLDCHSMAQRGPTTYAFAGEPRPLICLANLGGRDGEPLAGGEPVSCPGALLRAAAALAETHFGDLILLEADGPPPPAVALNWPFSGGYILRRYTAGGAPTEPRAPLAQAPLGIMVELNRGLYVGNQSAATPPAPPNLARVSLLRSRMLRWATDLCALLENA